MASTSDGLTTPRVVAHVGFPLPIVGVRPAGRLAPSTAVTRNTIHPEASSFHLRGFQTRSGQSVETLESIDAHGLHGCSCSSRSVEQYSRNTCSGQVEKRTAGVW